MRIRIKLTLSMLLTALLPLIICMGLALWHSTNQATKLTLDAAQGRLDTAAQKLSLFFSKRIAEVSTYSQMSVMKTMDFRRIRPFLMAELERHEATYEKYILGTPEGHFYNTSGGNPDVGGLRTFNDKDPNAKPKHIRQRDYWQKTVGKNEVAAQVTYVSDPMISYTTGAKQVVVASTILSESGEVRGMIGGALPWSDIQARIQRVHADLVGQLGWDAKFFLVSHTGTYWYHWDADKVVHLKVDEQGNPILNEIGEKVIKKSNIKDEKIYALTTAGERMLEGESGYASFLDPEFANTNYIVFSPISSAAYSIGLLVSKDQIMAPVKMLQSKFIFAFLIALVFVVLVAFLISRRVSFPIVSLSKMAKQISQGNLAIKLNSTGSDEIFELTQTFNTMASDLGQRELSLKQSEERLEKLNKELEQRIMTRTNELEVVNQSLKQQMNERIATEKALRSSEELLKNTGNLAHVGGWKLELCSNKLSWTEETFRIHGLSPVQSLTLDMAIASVAKEDQHEFALAIQNAREKGQDFDLELKIRNPQKNIIWVRVICHANESDGSVVSLVGAYQDITELKKVDRLKSEFVSTVSHELRTPLTSICGSLSLLKSGTIMPVHNKSVMQMLDIAERNSDRLLSLINDLLDMEKIEIGDIQFSLEGFPLGQLLAQSLADNESYSRTLNVGYQLIGEVPVEKIKVDKVRFLQVMSNLLSNAAKFTAPDTTIEVSVCRVSDDYFRISVRDHGQGVPESFKDKIFEKFSQADSSDTRQRGGTGLGLSISKSIVERMGGSIGFSSKDGEGSTFYFTVPVFKD